MSLYETLQLAYMTYVSVSLNKSNKLLKEMTSKIGDHSKKIEEIENRMFNKKIRDTKLFINLHKHIGLKFTPEDEPEHTAAQGQ